MKRILLFLLIALIGGMTLSAKGKEKKLIPDYSIEGVGSKSMSTSYVKVTIIAKKGDVDMADFGRCAIHGVLFRGYTNSESSYMSTPTSALMGSPMEEIKHADFFKSFFESTYSNYVNIQSESRRVDKIEGKKECKNSFVVEVLTEQLRRDLESMGMIEGINGEW